MLELNNPTPTYLAFDLGWSSSRVILGQLSGDNLDRIEIKELYRFTTPRYEQQGQMSWNLQTLCQELKRRLRLALNTRTEEQRELYWNLETLWQELNTGLRLALEYNPNICSLSVDSWGFDYVPLDAQGNKLRNAYCYRSSRTESVPDWVFNSINESLLYEVTGIQFLRFNTLCQVMADQQQESDLFARTENRLMMADYFNYCFAQRTQDVAVSEVSLVSTSGLLDVHNLDTPSWSTQVMNQLGIPTQSWPQIVQSGTIIGSLIDHPSIKVIASCSHDTACAVAAVPVAPNSPTWAYLSCGSWSLLGVELDAPITTEEARQANFTNEVGLDGTIRFLTNLTGLWVLQECQRQEEWEDLRGGNDFDYNTLLEEASNANNLDIIIDFNAPCFEAPDNMRITIEDYCRQRGGPVPQSRGELVRLILYSLASSYHTALSRLETIINEEIEILHIVGGGAQNYLLCQLVADVCQRQVVAGPTEATALGNLLIQARTMGHLPTNVSIREVVRNSKIDPIRTYYP